MGDASSSLTGRYKTRGKGFCQEIDANRNTDFSGSDFGSPTTEGGPGPHLCEFPFPFDSSLTLCPVVKLTPHFSFFTQYPSLVCEPQIVGLLSSCLDLIQQLFSSTHALSGDPTLFFGVKKETSGASFLKYFYTEVLTHNMSEVEERTRKRSQREKVDDHLDINFDWKEEGLFYALVLGGTNFYLLGVQLRCQFLLSWEHLMNSLTILQHKLQNLLAMEVKIFKFLMPCSANIILDFKFASGNLYNSP
ncbi:hypothetical protein K1719_005683 [Acacia pycnantha]|nr:hypothetical protein K1719_005683 [Acacia pycnantha]